MRPSTQAVHAGRPPHDPDQPLNTPITMASTYVAGGDLEYGRYANPTWTAELLENTLATGVVTIDGVEWTVYDNRDTGADVGNARYGLVTEAGESTFVLLGTADPEEFETLARAIVPAIDAQR